MSALDDHDMFGVFPPITDDDWKEYGKMTVQKRINICRMHIILDWFPNEGLFNKHYYARHLKAIRAAIVSFELNPDGPCNHDIINKFWPTDENGCKLSYNKPEDYGTYFLT